MYTLNKTILTTLALAICLACPAQQTVPTAEPTDTTETKKPVDQEKKSSKKKKKDDKEEKKEEKKPSEYEALLQKGGTEQKGLFTVRHIEDKYYFEVPDSLLGRYLLCVSRYTAVPQDFGVFAGEEANEATVYFERRDSKTMLMRAYVLTQLADEDSDIGKTLQASTIDPIVSSFKIIGRNKEDDAQLIEVTPLFKQDNNLVGVPSTARTTQKLGGLAGDRTFIDTIKVFPINIEVATTRTYNATPARSEASKTGNVTLGLNTSILLLPEEPMRKRLWDDRVGYFVNRFTRFNDEQHKTQHESIIARYRLVPKNVSKYMKGQLVEPVKQIVYYIDPATPKKWVPYLIQGVNDWNVAFEAAGFKNAIVAKEWPEDDENMSVDDARYCVLRYLPSETENAYGPHVSDPRSGEIIESHICWYHNVMNLLTKWYMVQCGPLDKRAQTMKFDDKLMGELIRFVSSHEVGHTLGLRHNMGASSATPVEKLRDKAWVEKNGHTASIMDYARFNYVAQPEDGISEKGLFPRINDYDKWAIKWGYQYRPEFKDEYEEKEALMKETTEVLRKNPKLWFGGEGRNEDSRAQTEDLGDNSMKASEYGIKNLKRVLANLPVWAKQENDQYDDLRDMYKAVRDQYTRYLGHVSKNIGARYYNNMPGKEPYADVPVALEKEALQFLGRHVFDAPEWLYPKSLTNKVGLNATNEHNSRQGQLMSKLLGPTLLTNIHNRGEYGIENYLNDLFAVVWKPLDGKSTWKDQTRRLLERTYVDNLNKLINPTEKNTNASTSALVAALTGGNSPDFNSDAMLYAIQHLDKVEQYIKAQQAQCTKGSINALHYEDLLNRLKLIRERRTTLK